MTTHGRTAPGQPRASLEEVLVTEALAGRPARAPDHAAEAAALTALAEAMTGPPQAVLQKLAELVIDLCGADSSGISILEPGGRDGIFRWHAVAGRHAHHLNSTVPRDASPCGTVLERDRVLLFDRPGRRFLDLADVDPPIVENLLVPFHADGKPIGTLWALGHTPEKAFDAEDARLLTRLSRFAAAAYRLMSERGELERRAQDRAAELVRAEAALRDSESRLADLAGTRRLYDLHAKLAVETDLKAALDEILAVAVDFAGTDRGCIQLPSDDGKRMEMVAHRGYGPESAFTEHFRGNGSKVGCETSKKERKRIIIEDVETFVPLLGTVDREVCLSDGIRAAQSTPMVTTNGVVVFILSTQYRRPHRPGEEQLRLIDL
ncbi:MAG: signal transduction histidine kinase, partial [Phycisphaerales bacterium]|nr:signal transduction histidine kinase [Phycisphaerales bacterium]